MKYVKKGWFKKSIFFLLILVLLTPLFAWAANKVGYSEPLENIAHQAGVLGEGYSLFSVFSEYSLPGFGSELGIILGALMGVLVTYLLVVSLGKILAKDN